jgi:hypothetical protein
LYQFLDRLAPYALDHPTASQNASASTANTSVKSEDAVMESAAAEDFKPTFYTAYSTAADIVYAPELALQEGLSMVKTLREEIKKVKLGSKLRQDVWSRELER